MKPGVYFINVVRGELVDQAALVEALRSGHVAGAALDVFEHEPLPPDDPLLRLDNVIVTPHWSASTTDVWQATSRAMIEGMLRAACGRVPDNIVNTAVLRGPDSRRSWLASPKTGRRSHQMMAGSSSSGENCPSTFCPLPARSWRLDKSPTMTLFSELDRLHTVTVRSAYEFRPAFPGIEDQP